jgi:hypothetical protein
MSEDRKINKVAGRAGEYLVCAGLSKLGIANLLLPEDYPGDEIVLSGPQGTPGYVNVKVRHRGQSETFILHETEARWRTTTRSNEFCVFVLLSASPSDEPHRCWIAFKREVGDLCVANSANETLWERHFYPDDFPQNWEDRWSLFDMYRLNVYRSGGRTLEQIPTDFTHSLRA